MTSLRATTKSILDLAGLLQPVKKARRWYAEQLYQYYYRQHDFYGVQIYGKEIIFSTKDRYSGRWFFPRYSNKIHEPKATELFARAAKGAENIIDVGANLGWFSCIAASISDGTVHAFEMDEDNLRRLNTNVSLNGLQNVNVNHAAVADSEGHVSYWKDSGTAGVDFNITKARIGKQEQIRVEAKTLDRYTEDHCPSVDLIKIDADGAEQKVLKGGGQTIREFHPHILLEVHPRLLDASSTSIQKVLGTLPDAYRIYEMRNFRWGGELTQEPIDALTFDPDQVSMLYAEPPGSSVADLPVPAGPLYKFPKAPTRSRCRAVAV